MAKIKFGTDGWRAVIAEDFTFENVSRVAQATASYWLANPVAGTAKKAVVGYDRRFLSDQFAQRTAEILAANGFTVTLTNCPTPTPAVSWTVKQQRGIGGVMLTASHNPPSFNGFKLKAWFGGSAPPEVCSAVEAMLDQEPVKSVPFADAVKAGQIVVKDIRAPYYSALKKLVDFPLIAKSKLKFAHEALFGVGAGCFERLLAGTTCQVTTINAAHDPFFGGINPEPIAKNYGRSMAYLAKHPHDLCLVTDGDADRVGGMDGRGNPLSTHQLICLLLHHYVVNKGMKGRVVKALTTTSMVDKFCAAHGLELVETGVGFKYIAAEMIKVDVLKDRWAAKQGIDFLLGPGDVAAAERVVLEAAEISKQQVLLGFEESGGIGFPGHIPERDGILAGLMLLELLATERKPLNKLLANLEKQFGPHRYGRIDTHFPLEKRAALMEFCKTNPPAKLLKSPLKDVKSYDGVKFCAEDGTWLMLRGSGTEPILRIYAEARSDADAQKLLQLGVSLTKKV